MKTVKMHRFRKKNFFYFVYIKWLNLVKNGVKVIVFNGKKWLNEKHIEKQLEHSNLSAVTTQYPPELKK